MGIDDLLDVSSAKELGNYLKIHRKRANISLEEIQKHTKIRVKYLKALEAGDFSVIPGGDAYVKGFLQNYAKTVGLDTSEVLDIYKRLKGESSPEDEMIKSDEYEKTDDIISSFIDKFSSRGIVFIIIIAAIVIVLFFSLRLIKDMPSNTSPSSIDKNQGMKIESEGIQDNLDEDQDKDQNMLNDDSEIAEDINEGQVQIKEDTKQKTVYEVDDDAINVVLEVLNDRCWINVKKDGTFEYEGILSTGDSKEFRSNGDLVIRVGNPLVVKVKVNNKDLGVLGGQARDIIFIKRGE